MKHFNTLIFHLCDSTWEKGPSRAFFLNRVIATMGKSRLSYKMRYIFSDESKV